MFVGCKYNKFLLVLIKEIPIIDSCRQFLSEMPVQKCNLAIQTRLSFGEFFRKRYPKEKVPDCTTSVPPEPRYAEIPVGQSYFLSLHHPSIKRKSFLASRDVFPIPLDRSHFDVFLDSRNRLILST